MLLLSLLYWSVVRGDSNANMFNFTVPLVDFGKVLCSFANKLQQNSNPFLEKYIYHTFWLFCHRFIAFIFEIMSVIHKQWLVQYDYSNVQSALMTGFWTDFMSSVWNFCRWAADVPPREMSPSGDEGGEMSVFAGHCWPCFSLFNKWEFTLS